MSLRRGSAEPSPSPTDAGQTKELASRPLAERIERNCRRRSVVFSVTGAREVNPPSAAGLPNSVPSASAKSAVACNLALTNTETGATLTLAKPSQVSSGAPRRLARRAIIAHVGDTDPTAIDHVPAFPTGNPRIQTAIKDRAVYWFWLGDTGR